MMERIFLTLLFLAAWEGSSSITYRYHYVPNPMTWVDAQAYCRKTYTDLATVATSENTTQFFSTVSSLNSGYVWIGLTHKIEWKWSDGSEIGDYDRPWEPNGEPNFKEANQFCGQIGSRGTWYDDGCDVGYPILCYSGTPENPTYSLVSTKMDWSSAQSHCRANYKDLATVKNDAQNDEAKLQVPSGEAWTGLYRDPNLIWSDGTVSTYTNWEAGNHPLGSNTLLCVVADMQNGGNWKLKPCHTKYAFVCYTTPPTKQLMKLKFKVEDSVDMNDPAVKAKILKKLQDKLKQDGLSGVTLRWREQPDGKVIYKEETCPRKKNNENFQLCE